MPNRNKIDVNSKARGNHRPRSRERDQRMPTFQVLEKLHHNNPAEVKRVEPPPIHYTITTNQKRKSSKSPHTTIPVPTARRHSHHEAPKSRNYTASYSPGKKSFGSDGSSGGSGGNSRRSSVNSRGPACSFASQFHISDQRSRSYSPAKRKFSPGRKSGEESLDEEEEPNDVLVWDTARKASRSNILCPLTDSEFHGFSVVQTKTRVLKKYNVDQKPKSAPQSCRSTQSSEIVPLDGHGKVETLDDQLPPSSPKEAASSTVSIHSTSKHKIDLIGKQLDEIYHVQNDILNQLGDSIASTQTENHELKNEISALRHNNSNLVVLLNDMSDELERMKHIFRSRGMPFPASSNRFASLSPPLQKMEKEEKTQTPPLTATSVGVQYRSRSRESSVKSSSPGRKRRSSREEETIKSDTKPDAENEAHGEAFVEISVIKDRKGSRENKRKKQAEHCNGIDPYHDEETDSSIFRNDSDNSFNALGEGLIEAIVTTQKKRSKESKTAPNTRTRTSKSSRDREKSTRDSSGSARKNDANSTRKSVGSKKTTRPKSRGGCFGIFNLFSRQKPTYDRDSEDNIVTLNDT